jgi:hypothetical protein
MELTSGFRVNPRLGRPIGLPVVVGVVSLGKDAGLGLALCIRTSPMRRPDATEGLLGVVFAISRRICDA